MSNLYEINIGIRELLDACVDPETGEWIATEQQELDFINLKVERFQKLQAVAKYIINLRADQSALKAEEERLCENRKKLEKKEETLRKLLDREANGEKLDLGIATYSYRSGTRVELENEELFKAWSAAYHPEFLKTSVTVNKADLKAFLKKAEEVTVPGAKLVTERKGSLK